MAKLKTLTLAAAAVVALALPGSADAAGDAAKGKKAYNACKACHTLTGKHTVGPSLKGIMGRKAADTDFKRYSKSLKAAGEKGLVWNEETLDGFIAKPKKWMSDYLGEKAKIRMAYPGEKKADKRADIIAYIKEASQ